MHKNSILILALSLLLYGIAGSQPVGFKSAENQAEFRSKFSEAGKKISSIASDFIQEKNLALLEEKIISEGKFWYKRANKVRLEYQRPFKYLMVLNGDQMMVRDEQKENRMNTHSSKLFQQINEIMMGSINGTILESKNFTSQVFQNEKSYLLVMTPNTKSLKEFFQNILVNVDKNDFSVLGITMNEPGGDNTIMTFTNRVINQNLNDSLFNP